MLHRFVFIGLMAIAQQSWAIAVLSDTLILDGEVIYVEEKSKTGADSLIKSKQQDFKMKRKDLSWALEFSSVGSYSKYSWSHIDDLNLISIPEFMGDSQKVLGGGFKIGAFTQMHKQIHVGFGIDYLKMNLTMQEIIPENTGLGTSFFSSTNSIINQVIEVEIQPGAYETDTLQLPILSNELLLQQLAIPVHFRFYVNEYSNRKNWRAFGQISPALVWIKQKPNSNSNQILFLNGSGAFQTIAIENSRHLKGNVAVKCGLEYKISKYIQANVGVVFYFPPISLSYSNQIQNSISSKQIEIGLRWSKGNWKN
ncbi:MAG: hypothetical protein ACKO8Q_10410 [Bacteroidota bacterium]